MAKKRSIVWRVFVPVLLAFYPVAIPCLFLPAIILLVVAETIPGRLFAVLVLSVFWLPASVLYAWMVKRRGKQGFWRRWSPCLVFGALLLAAAVVLVLLAPSGEPVTGSGLSSHFPGELGYGRYSIWNLLPEIDQVRVGIILARYADATIDSRQAERIRELTMPVYRELQRRPEYAHLGSVMNYAYAELLGGEFDTGHFYQYLPSRGAGEKLPALVFLHGFGGNFKCYLWAWEQFAREHSFIVVCPSFGLGDWSQPGGVEAVERARKHCVEKLEADPDRVYLVGLSNGGLGVSRAGARHPSQYAGLVYLSGAMESHILGSDAFVAGWQHRPVLIVHGAKDRRLSKDHVDAAVSVLEWGKVRVTCRMYRDEDHFLFLSSREELFADLAAWLEGS